MVSKSESKNIVICCDGTANEPKAKAATNVFELMRVMERTEKQILYYDPGLGTESSPMAQTFIGRWVTKILGLMFGYGLRKNILDAYSFLMAHYQPGDKIYIFGFSRGAYTARAIAGMLYTIGLLDKGSHHLLSYAAKKYMQQGKREWANIGAFKGALSRQLWGKSPFYEVPVHFLGVWDTVKSVGLLRDSVQLPYTRSLPNVDNGFHAVALDEKRSKFRPDLWATSGDTKGRVQTIWFEGTHSDVGGGHPESEKGLSDISMQWMVDQAMSCGLKVAEDELRSIQEGRPNNDQNSFMQIHNSLLPLWWILGWWKRKLPNRFWIHHTSVERNLAANDAGKLKHPYDIFQALGSNSVYRKDKQIIIKCKNAYLVQDFTAVELKHLEDYDLPEDSSDALKLLLKIGADSWQSTLKAQLDLAGSSISQNSTDNAIALMERALGKIGAGKIKGERGALADILKLTRMRSLKKEGLLSKVMESSPTLVEGLAEHIPR